MLVDYRVAAPVHSSYFLGSLDGWADFLLSLSASLSLTGETPFTSAVAHGNMELVRYLLDQGADKEKLNDDGYTPLHLASGKGSIDLYT
jgi:ankyrin repeat protein